MNVSVCIPYAGHDERRERALRYVARRYRELGYEIRIGVRDDLLWRKGEAVRSAVDRAAGEILVVADADVWSDYIVEAVEAVRDGVGWATPHWQVNRLDDPSTDRFIAGERDDLTLEEDHHGVAGGGIVVLRRETYERAPIDTRFVGWGGEDKAWAFALRTLAGPSHRIRQPLWHLWHRPQERMTRAIGSPQNDALRAEYAGASGQPRRMRELIAEGRACRSTASSSKT